MDPEQSPEQGNRYSIRESLQELWRGVTFFFNRSPQEPVEAAHVAQPVEGALEARWREITETRKRVGELAEESKVTGDVRPAAQALEELKLRTANYDKLLEEMQAPMRAMLGRNFLGTEEWRRGFGVHVGAPPPMPEYITADLLNSDCKLHPGKRIKDTHILVLMPKTVDGDPYSPLKLDELCAARKGSGDRLIFHGERGVCNEELADLWKSTPWANAAELESKWILIPKMDPDQLDVSRNRHFREKNSKGQEKVYQARYSDDYRPARVLEVMTAALLSDVLYGEPRMLEESYGWYGHSNVLRCVERNLGGDRITVGDFGPSGLRVFAHTSDQGRSKGLGYALVMSPRHTRRETG
jgi:hypothetical protein